MESVSVTRTCIRCAVYPMRYRSFCFDATLKHGCTVGPFGTAQDFDLESEHGAWRWGAKKCRSYFAR